MDTFVKKILIIDDQKAIRNTLKEILEYQHDQMLLLYVLLSILFDLSVSINPMVL